MQHTAKDKEQLSFAVSQVCLAQKAYGRNPAEIRQLVEMFSTVLAEYPMQAIINGMLEHVKRKPEIPTPSDIANLIDPPPAPLSPAVYTQIKRRAANDVYVTPEEREYCRRFENQELEKIRGGSPILREAQREIALLKGGE